MASVTAPGLSPAADRSSPATMAPPAIAPSTARETGRVSWFCADRGFGWVLADDGTDLFVSYGDLPGSGFRCVAAGERVQFLRGEDGHGAVARSVSVHARHDASDG